MAEHIRLDSIEDAIADVCNGKIIIVVDDENRENEGDFVGAAEMVTPEMINFMAQHGRGLICTPITEQRSKDLDLYPMVNKNTDPMGTAFTVSIDLKGDGVTSGISVADRAKTVRHLIHEEAKADDFLRPGHIFPLTAKEGGVLRRTGHTEAAIDFARLAGFKPAGVIVEIMNEDGSMARLPQLRKVADKYGLKLVSIEDLVSYRMKHDSLIDLKEDFNVTTAYGDFRLRAYHQKTNNQVHLALTLGTWAKDEAVLTRVHTQQLNSELMRILSKNEHSSLDGIFKRIQEEGKGAVIFINQLQPANQLLAQLNAVKTKKTAPIKMDEKDFGIGAQMIHAVGISNIKLLSNSDKIKRVGMSGYGLQIVSYEKY
jgi:3,4-dihydroxy 2-butanone 4-phosphate synthase/GTP cyclohydrolase II